ncbi:MAG: T9SS type A sorting domain-containing protein [Candidatus Latescibacteria bacterium]|nr:T9SS type A sorting domain-containing protein [Candidatus Latescibacterota bacterium]
MMKKLIHSSLGASSLVGLVGLIFAWPLGAQSIFTDVTAEMGLAFDWTSRSIALGDYDNDGRVDLFRGQNGPPPCCEFNLLGNEGDRFTDRSVLLAAIPSTWIGGGVIWGDYDNDGDQDLFVGLGVFFGNEPSRNRLFRNDRGVFVEVGEDAGLTDVLATDNALWLDYDRDGYLDLYMGNMGWISGGPEDDHWDGDPTVRNKLYRNQGDGTFADITAAAGLDIEFHPVIGGTGGGIVAADFDNDDWTDLYIATLGAPNRLFLNDRQGGFTDATRGDVADTSQAFGVAVGDIDNDGRLDIFQASGGLSGSVLPFRSLLLQNLGGGDFLDILEGAGLQALQADNAESPGLADVDNDGDLDLVLSQPRFLFLNTGTGFEEATDRAGFGPTGRGGNYLSLGDFDSDGFVDLLTQRALFRNNGNDNHWLVVDPVGTVSNRDGIGARVLTVAGELRQVREIMGGNGFNQDPKVAHFGLGHRTRVDSLEIRWPSGQVDIWTDIPADQQIRVFEGRPDYHVVGPTRWEEAPPAVVVDGAGLDFRLAVRPALFEPDAEVTQVTADLSGLGGAPNAALTDAGDGIWRLQTPLVAEAVGWHRVSVLIEQATALGPYWTQLRKEVAVWPSADQIIWGEDQGAGWALEVERNIAAASSPVEVFVGDRALGLESSGIWAMRWTPAEPVALFGGEVLRLALHPGSSSGDFLNLTVNTKRVPVWTGNSETSLVDWENAEWQAVAINLEELGVGRVLTQVRINGDPEGVFYLDEFRLSPPGATPPTAVLESFQQGTPQELALGQNYPNPFNSETSIRFSLPAAGEVDLGLYNLAGQQVATLMQGERAAGAYTLQWDGRDDGGRGLASGVYLYHLRAGGQMQTRKLLLLR